MTFMREIKNSAINRIYDYINQAVNDGNQIAKVDQKGNRIALVSRARSLKQSKRKSISD